MTPPSLASSATNGSDISPRALGQRGRLRGRKSSRKNRGIGESLAWIFRTNLPPRRGSLHESKEKRNWFGFGEVLDVVANPSDTLEQMKEMRKQLERAQYELRLHATPFASCLPPQSFTISSLPQPNPSTLPRPSESSALHQIFHGTPTFTVLCGAPSVGKTTLLREVLKDERYYVLYFDMKVVGGAGLEGLFSGLCAAVEWFVQSMLRDIKEGAKEDEELEKVVKAVKHGSRILADRLDKPYSKDINTAGGITTTDVARLIQLFRTALLLSWQLPGRPLSVPRPRPGPGHSRLRSQPSHHRLHTSEAGGEGTSSEETKIAHGHGERQGRVQFDDRVEKAGGLFRQADIDSDSDRDWEGVSLAKRIPVLVFDDAQKLSSLARSPTSSQVLQYLLEGLVVLSKQDRLCHVVHTTNDGLYVCWLREMGLDGFKILTLADSPKPQTRTYLDTRILPSIPSSTRSRLESEQGFEKLYDAFGGRLAHWTDFVADWENTGGDLLVERSNPFLQAYAQLNFLLLRASEGECEDQQLELEEEAERGQHGPDHGRRSRMRTRAGEQCHSRCRSRSRSHGRLPGRRGMKSSTTLIGLGTAEAGDTGFDRKEEKEEKVPFTTMELLDIFYRLTTSSTHSLASVASPTIRPVSMKSVKGLERGEGKEKGISYFALCRELGSMQSVDFLVRAKIVEMRWGRVLPSSSPSSSSTSALSTAHQDVPLPIAGPSTSTYNLGNLHFPSPSREDIVPVDEHIRDVDGSEIGPGVVGTLGPVLLPTSPILAYAMKVVLDEYGYQPPQEEIVDGVDEVVDSDSVTGVRRSVIGARGGRGGRDEGLFYGEEGYDTRARESSDGQSDYVSLEDVSEY